MQLTRLLPLWLPRVPRHHDLVLSERMPNGGILGRELRLLLFNWMERLQLQHPVWPLDLVESLRPTGSVALIPFTSSSTATTKATSSSTATTKATKYSATATDVATAFPATSAST